MYLKSLVNYLRYLVLVSPLVWITLLNGCGTGTVLDPFVPNRIIAFGDAFMDVRTPRFTVNDEIPLPLANLNATNPNLTATGYLTASTYQSTATSSTHGFYGNSTTLTSANYYTYAFNSLFPVGGYLASNTVIPYYTSSNVLDAYAPALLDTTTNAIDTPFNPELTVIERIAADYGFGAVIPMSQISTNIVPSNSGVYSFAQANALVMNTGADVAQSYTATYSYNSTSVSYPGAATPALSVQAQIDLFLAKNAIAASDLIIINAGSADVMLQASQKGSGASGVISAAQNFVSQIMRLKNAGAKHIVVFGPPNMGRSPFAYKYGLTTTLAGYSKTLNSSSCSDFNCALENGLQQAIGTITENPVLFVDISSQTSLITGTTNTGSTNTYASFADPLYAVSIQFPGDPAFSDYSSTAPVSAVDGNYYCNSTNIPVANNTNYPTGLNSTPLFYIQSPAMTATISGSVPSVSYNFAITGAACFANPASPTSTNAVTLNYASVNSTPILYNYLSYAYADAVYFTPSVHRMLGDFVLGKLSLASWR